MDHSPVIFPGYPVGFVAVYLRQVQKARRILLMRVSAQQGRIEKRISELRLCVYPACV